MPFAAPCRTMAVAVAFGALMATAAVAQDGTAAPNATGAADAPLATGLLNDGWAEARLTQVDRDGDKLTVRVRFAKAEGVTGNNIVYSGLSEAMWQSEFYILAGDKKYLLLKDSAGVPLAPNTLNLSSSGPQAGTWHGTFPAPPAGETATLHIVGMEPLGPFTVPQ